MTAADGRRTESYRPHLRTALVLTGVGTAGAYQAGVLRALQEAGIKIDLVAAHGVGAGTALLAAVDNGSGLWERGGVWRDPRTARLYALRPSLRAALAVAVAGCLVVALPLAVLATGLLAYPLGFLVGLVSPEGGRALTEAYSGLVGWAFESGLLPALLPRLGLLTVVVAVLVVGAAAAGEFARRGARRREAGPWWARVVAVPWSARAVGDVFREALWKGLRGASPAREPSVRELSRRYVDVLVENLGQPGFRELVLATHDVDARRDLVFALLANPFRDEFLRQGPGGSRRPDGEVVNLAGVGRDHVFDALAGAVSVPVLTPGHAMTFAVDSYWRGETHVLSDRAGLVPRLLDEAAAAGARQVILVTATAARGWPHGLARRRQTLRARVGEHLAGDGLAALDDALVSRAALFEGVFPISPQHNPLGPFDFDGARDERSDRTYPLAELVDRGYEDAYRQFIEPVVGGSGEGLQGTE